MHITFDTSNPSDLKILSALLALAVAPQPEVGQNTGTAVLSESPSLPNEDSGVSGAAEVDAAPAPEKAKRGRKPKAEKIDAPEDPKEPPVVVTGQEWIAPGNVEETDAPAAVEETVSGADVSEAKPLTLDEVRAALQQFTTANGIPAGIALLKEFNAGRISELDASNYSAFAARCA